MFSTGGASRRIEDRGVPRDEVHHRTRASGPDGRVYPLLVVNISPGGLMARSEADHVVGDRLRILLPLLGSVPAEVRWSLGGRIGCQFADLIGHTNYAKLLGTLIRGH